MKSVLSLIGNPHTRFALEAALGRAEALLHAHGLKTGTPRILAPDLAGEIPFDGADAKDTGLRAREALHAIPADINIVPAQNRRKRLLVADMDSTIITCECLDEIADFAGLKPKVAAITERAMRGELAFAPALRERVALLKGMPEATLQKVFDDRVRLTAGARTLVQTMNANGALTVLVSGGFRFFTSRVAAEAGFAQEHANILETASGQLTGTVAEPILGREAKLDVLQKSAAARGLALGDALAVGDGANDLAMIEAARDAGGLGIAFHAKPLVAEAAGVRIDHGDLTALLYLQGYAANEFAAG